MIIYNKYNKSIFLILNYLSFYIFYLIFLKLLDSLFCILNSKLIYLKLICLNHKAYIDLRLE